MRRLSDSVAGIAVVTGAGSGIGRATTLHCLDAGWHVIAIDRQEDALSRLTDEAEGASLTRLAVQPLDVADALAVAAWAEGLAAHHGGEPVRALVNAAGVGLFARKLDTITPDGWHRVLAVDLGGPFLMTKYLVPLMAPGSQIIHLSSVHAEATSFGMAAYASAKAGLLALTRATAIDYRRDGIRCNCLVIGSVDTPMSRQHGEALAAEGLGAPALDPTLVAQPEAIAEVIEWLASGRASFVNGAAIRVDGGLLADLWP